MRYEYRHIGCGGTLKKNTKPFWINDTLICNKCGKHTFELGCRIIEVEDNKSYDYFIEDNVEYNMSILENEK